MTNKMQKRRVVVTGLGAVTPLGNTMNDTWNGIVEGRVVCGPVQAFDATQFPTTMAYEVREFGLNDEPLTEKEKTYLSPAAAYGFNAAMEAYQQAGLDADQLDSTKSAVCIGMGMSCPSFDWYNDNYFHKELSDAAVAQHVPMFPDHLARVLARVTKSRGEITTVHTACASSGQAVGEAYELIAYGDADRVLTGGADTMIHPFYFAGFSLLGALSRRSDDPRTASRPFDVNREGFVLGEGACMMMLEDYDSAKERGANIIAEICGYGVTESAYRITDLHPEGEGPIEAMEMAVADAGISAEAVGYVNAHGTSTPLNDRLESLAISKVFSADKTKVSSSKSMTGHMISAAGAIELAICIQSLQHQVLPPSANLFQKDPECRVTVTGPEPEPVDLQYALSNSVGFGGSNTAIIAGRVK